ncbi:MAG: outer membrane lipoprotein carrier protein LolA [Candidatus Zixiibacteriota bacterium]|nr:MAG: outer membrane lipoprotein carrier protein LolA [candidate division Zixibacteria bacterium]
MRYLPGILGLLMMVCSCTAQTTWADDPLPSATNEQTLNATEASAESPNHAESGCSSAEAWLDRIEQKAACIETLTARLRYDNNQLFLGDEQRRFGTLVYRAGPPPRFRVHFDRKLVDGHWSQPDLYYIFDGIWLLKRDHENKSAVRYQLVDEADPDDTEMSLTDGPFPLPFNLRKDRVLQRYEVQLVEDDTTGEGGDVHLKLTPRDLDDTKLREIDLWFDRQTLLPVRVETLDDSETQTVVYLSEVQVNVDLDDDTFDTSLPNDTGWQTDENRLAPVEPDQNKPIGEQTPD